MTKSLHAIAVGALALPLLAGCATKGFVRKELAAQRMSVDSSISSNIATERSARLAGDSANAAGIAANTRAIASLRTDLDSLRTQFGARMTTMENGMKFDMPVNFAFDDATVRDTDRPMLDQFAKVVQKHYNGSVITIEGFADPAGTHRYNLSLSKRRADNVVSYLQTAGLTASQLRSVGYGEERQVVKGAQRDEPGAEQNRRVVFVVESKPQTSTGVATIQQ
ncbi:MAG: OmpA family protein [Gemmatimonadota bacterium]|nr:OmpA family protein [Gemmatimonadota bacterium]